MWTEDEKEFINIWNAIHRDEGDGKMGKKSRQIGKGYISDLKKFEIFLRDFLSFIFGNYRDTKGFKEYLKDCDSDLNEYPDFNEFCQWFYRMWEDYLFELIDMAIYYSLTEYEDKLGNTITKLFENRMIKNGIDLYGAVAEQIKEYLSEKKIEGNLFSLFFLLMDLEKEYGKSKYKKHFRFGID